MRRWIDPMRIAFYAPLKPPTDPVPSGDRRMARLLMQALSQAGHEVVLASRFRSYDGAGDAVRQDRLRRIGGRLATQFLRRTRDRKPDLWFTYHLYHKAPDWLGPTVAWHLGIPYVLAEASHAGKQEHGPWRAGWAAARSAIAEAGRAFSLNPEDDAGIRPLLRDPSRLVGLPPFLDLSARPAIDRMAERAAIAAHHGLAPDAVWIAVAAMMRPGAKQESYRLLAEALSRLAAARGTAGWAVLIAGDGPARDGIASAFPALPNLRFLGALAEPAMGRFLTACDLYAWPAIGEAYGMAILEAQAAGLPVVAADRPGIAAMVAADRSGLLVPEADTTAFTAALERLIERKELRQNMRLEAVSKIVREHSIDVAAARLDAGLAGLVRRNAA
ncbi:MAG: glycosyltransferase family 4 protein [Alphaproteobacteria bacterium]